MPPKTSDWLLLITNLPGRNAMVRMRVWRALKAAGAALLKDGVYVLPHSTTARRLFDEQAEEIRAVGGAAHVLTVHPDTQTQFEALRGLFDRTAEYTTAHRELEALKRSLNKLSELDARQRLASCQREIAVLIKRDFFPGATRVQIESTLKDTEAALNARFAPEEPHSAHQKIKHCDRSDYQGRTWATREHLWVDRVACAWLIRRFIDPKARFLWLKRVKDCPKRAVGFDFDGAPFTHVDSKVTFEVLLASFALEQDEGLSRLGALVHYLDVGGIPVPEAPGFASILTGARKLQANDDALLTAMTPVLDSLYTAYDNPNR